MRWPPETIGFASPLKRLQVGDEMRLPVEKIVAWRVAVVVVVVVVVINVGAAMRFAGPLKRMWRGNGIRRPAEMYAARRCDSTARGKDCGAAMGFAGPLK